MNYFHLQVYCEVLSYIAYDIEFKNTPMCLYPFITKSERHNLMSFKDDNTVESVKALIKYGVSGRYLVEAYKTACFNGNIDVIKYLLKQNVNINCDHQRGLNMAVAGEQFETVKFLISKRADFFRNKSDIFRSACQRNSIEIVEYLLDKKAKIHANNDEGLYNAVFHNNFELVKFLIEHKATVNRDVLRMNFDGHHKEIFDYISNHVLNNNRDSE